MAYCDNELHKLQIIVLMHDVMETQQTMLQDYFAIQMCAKYGNEWIKKVIEKCEEKVSFCKSKEAEFKAADKYYNYPSWYREYKNILDHKNKYGLITINKTTFDSTIVIAFLSYDFTDECYANSSEGEKREDTNKKLFLNYINTIRLDRNELRGHLSNTKDEYRIGSLASTSIENLKIFINYLDLLGWSTSTEERKEFIYTYKAEIEKLNNLKTGRMNVEQLFNVTTSNKEFAGNSTNATINSNDERDNEKVKRVNIAIAVKDKFGNFVSGYSLKMFNSNDEAVLTWITSDATFCLLTDVGDYRIEEIDVPKGYKKGETFKFTVKTDDDDKTFVKKVEQSVSNEDLYFEAFNYLSDSQTYEQGMSLLYKLEKANYLEAQLLLAFILKTGICCKRDIDKAEELLMFAAMQKDERTWLDCATKEFNEGKYMLALPYYTAYSQKTGKAIGYYQAGRLLTMNIKNYDFCRMCLKLAIENGISDANAETAYDFICKIGKEQYMKL